MAAAPAGRGPLPAGDGGPGALRRWPPDNSPSAPTAASTPTPWSPSAGKMDVRYSITVRQHQSLRNLIEAIPETDWTPIPYWMDGGADVAETEYTPFQHEPDAAPTRLIVRRVQPAPGSQLALLTDYSYHACITDREGEHSGTGGRPPPPCRDRERHPRPEVRRGPQSSPSGRFPATPPGWRCRSWPTIWLAGRRASAWASWWLPPRPCGDASSP